MLALERCALTHLTNLSKRTARAHPGELARAYFLLRLGRQEQYMALSAEGIGDHLNSYSLAYSFVESSVEPTIGIGTPVVFNGFRLCARTEEFTGKDLNSPEGTFMPKTPPLDYR
jgi:hypothetical protein